MMEWRYKVGDVIKLLPNRGLFTVAARCVFALDNYSYRLMDEYCELFTENKDSVEKYFELVKPKSIYEQALDLLGIKIDQEFTCNLNTNIYKFTEDGTAMFKPWFDSGNKFYDSDYTISYFLIKDRNIKIHKPKSEAELIIDELKVAMDKANEILRKGGY